AIRQLHSFPTRRSSDLAASAPAFAVCKLVPGTEMVCSADVFSFSRSAASVPAIRICSTVSTWGADFFARTSVAVSDSKSVPLERSEEHTSELQSLAYLV